MVERSAAGQTTPSTFVENLTTSRPVSSDFDTAITPTGLLVEEARTNICLQSEDFGTTWTLGSKSATNADQAIAPDGTLTADEVVDDGVSASPGQVYVTQAVTVGTATAYTYSAYLKANALTIGVIAVAGFTTPADSEAWFDLSAGTVGTVDAGFDNSGIEDVGNGWFRCWVTFTTDAADTTGNIRIHTAESDASLTVTIDGTSSIFIWGAQLEVGAFPSSYIPTVAASVTRNADVVSTASMAWADATQGSYYVQAALSSAALGTWYTVAGPRFLEANSSTQDVDRFVIFGSGGIDPSVIQEGNNTSSSIDTGAGLSPGDVTRIVSGYDSSSGLAAYVDGVAGPPDLTITVPDNATDFTTFNVGSRYLPSAYLNGHIAEIRYYNERLTDAQLEDMSNGIFPTAGFAFVNDLVTDLVYDLPLDLTS